MCIAGMCMNHFFLSAVVSHEPAQQAFQPDHTRSARLHISVGLLRSFFRWFPSQKYGPTIGHPECKLNFCYLYANDLHLTINPVLTFGAPIGLCHWPGLGQSKARKCRASTWVANLFRSCMASIPSYWHKAGFPPAAPGFPYFSSPRVPRVWIFFFSFVIS